MAKKGALFLDNSAVKEISKYIKGYESTAQEALYSQYKVAYKISLSNHFRGKAADDFKNYITHGAINIISGFLDLTSELSMFSQILEASFFQYEGESKGKVEEGALDYINENLNSKERTFESARSELDAVLNSASNYITVKKLSLDSVNSGYVEARRVVKRIREGLYEVDDETLTSVNELFTRIKELKTLIERMINYCYNKNGKINAYNLPKIQSQDWFEKAGNLTLYFMLHEDPFHYTAGEVTVAEDQWAAGLCSDVYGYAGYSWLSASSEVGREDGTAYAKGEASVLKENMYAQYTNYLAAEAEAKFGYAEGDAKAGFSSDYIGARAEGEVGLAKVDGCARLGTEDLNLYAKGKAEAFTARGKAAFDVNKDGEFAMGFMGSATAGELSGDIGFSAFDLSVKDQKTGETIIDKNKLFDIKLEGSLSAGGGGGLWLERKKVHETEYANIYTETIEIDLELLLGLKISLTVPSVDYKWTW